MKEINIAPTLICKRKEKGITQEELAEYMGVTKASVSKWETGQSYPDITLLPRLAAYFNISVDELIGYLPQMTREDIQKTINRFISRFGSRPFEEVMAECREAIKKYYSCFPFLLQMAILLLNHYNLAQTKEKQEGILKEILSLCQRIKQEDEDVWLKRHANSIEACCYIALAQPEPVFALLDGIMKPMDSDEILLASAYQLSGNTDRAAMVIQVALFQRLVELSDFASSHLMMQANSPAKFEEALRRFIALNEIFHMEHLNPNAAAKLYFAAAQGYSMQQNPDRALEMLEKYALVCRSMMPYELKSDDFFDRVEDWMAEQNISTHAPRESKHIKASMIEIVEQNPMFAPLAALPKFQSVLQILHSIKE